jgi:hypothetical protein
MNGLHVLRLTLRYLHLVGFALLFGGFLAQYLTGRFRVNILMRTGLGTMIGTGLMLAIPFPPGEHLNYLKLATKFTIVVAIGALFGVAVTRAGRDQPVHRAHFMAIGTLVLLTAGVAVFWT